MAVDFELPMLARSYIWQARLRPVLRQPKSYPRVFNVEFPKPSKDAMRAMLFERTYFSLFQIIAKLIVKFIQLSNNGRYIEPILAFEHFYYKL